MLISAVAFAIVNPRKILKTRLYQSTGPNSTRRGIHVFFTRKIKTTIGRKQVYLVQKSGYLAVPGTTERFVRAGDTQPNATALIGRYVKEGI